jgi:hypothetical protein
MVVRVIATGMVVVVSMRLVEGIGGFGQAHDDPLSPARAGPSVARRVGPPDTPASHRPVLGELGLGNNVLVPPRKADELGREHRACHRCRTVPTVSTTTTGITDVGASVCRLGRAGTNSGGHEQGGTPDEA